MLYLILASCQDQGQKCAYYYEIFNLIHYYIYRRLQNPLYLGREKLLHLPLLKPILVECETNVDAERIFLDEILGRTLHPLTTDVELLRSTSCTVLP